MPIDPDTLKSAVDTGVAYTVTFFMKSGMNFQIDLADIKMTDDEIAYQTLPDAMENEQLLHVNRNEIEAVTYKGWKYPKAPKERRGW